MANKQIPQPQQVASPAFNYTAPTAGVQTQPVNVQIPSKTASVFENLNKLVVSTGQVVNAEITAKTTQIEADKKLTKETYNQYIEENTNLINTKASQLKAALVDAVARNTKGSKGIDEAYTTFTTGIANIKKEDSNKNEIKDKKLLSLLDVFESNTSVLLQQEKAAALKIERKEDAENKLINTATSGTINVFNFSSSTKDQQKAISISFNNLVDTYANAHSITKGDAANIVFKTLLQSQFTISDKTTVPQLKDMQDKLQFFAENIEGTDENGKPKRFLVNQSTFDGFNRDITNFVNLKKNNIESFLRSSMAINNNINEVDAALKEAVTNGVIEQRVADNYRVNYIESQQKELTEKQRYISAGGVSGYSDTFSNPSHKKFYREDILNSIKNNNFQPLAETMYNAPETAIAIIGDVINDTASKLMQPMKKKDGTLYTFKEKAAVLSEISKLTYKNSMTSLPSHMKEEMFVIKAISDLYGNDDKRATVMYEKYLQNKTNYVDYKTVPLSKETKKEIDKLPATDRELIYTQIKVITSITGNESKATELVLKPLQSVNVAGVNARLDVLEMLNIDPSLKVSTPGFMEQSTNLIKGIKTEKPLHKMTYFIEGLQLYYRNKVGDTNTALNIGEMNRNGDLLLQKSSFRGTPLELHSKDGVVFVDSKAIEAALTYANNKVLLNVKPKQQEPKSQINLNQQQQPSSFIRVDGNKREVKVGDEKKPGLNTKLIDELFKVNKR